MDCSRSSRKRLRRSIAPLALLAASSALYSWTANPAGEGHAGGVYQPRPSELFTGHPRQRQLDVQQETDNDGQQQQQQQQLICDRPIHPISSPQHLSVQQTYATCPTYPSSTPILYLDGHLTFGRTANHLRTLTNAVQYARDHHVQLAIAYRSWAMDVLLQFFMASADGAWESHVEDDLCIKIVRWPEELREREVITKSAAELFYYASPAAEKEYTASQLHILRTLFMHANDGGGHNQHGGRAKDMCQGIHNVFRDEDASTVIYSAVHLRFMEGKPGRKLLKEVANVTGCDPRAALAMSPDYIKSILAPLGMLEHPIVVITDRERPQTLQRLREDPDLGPRIRTLPEYASWLGGDIALAALADVFIGNPASTFSGFIARTRVALGIDNNYLFRAMDGEGNWTSVCDDSCLFRRGAQVDAEFIREKEAIMSDKRFTQKGYRTTIEHWMERRGERARQMQGLADGGATLHGKELRNAIMVSVGKTTQHRHLDES